MLRLEQATRPDDLARLDARVRARIGPTRWSVEARVIGAPVTLVFEDGVLAAATHARSGGPPRDVTEHVRAIRTAPIRLAGDHRPVPRVLVVHGTATLRPTAYARLRRALREAGREAPRTLAQAVAEVMAHRDPAHAACWPLDLVAHDVAPAGDGLGGLQRQRDVREALAHWGFCLADALGEADDPSELLALIEGVATRRDDLTWELDGVVVKLDAIADRGLVAADATPGRVPWAAVVPVEPRRVWSRVVDLGCALDRFGGLRCLATVRPVCPDGGAEIFEALVPDVRCAPELADLRVGDRVGVGRCGDAAGEGELVLEHVPAPEAERGEPFVWPDTCPSCGLELTGPRRRRQCLNRFGCGEQILARLHHFVAAATGGAATDPLRRWVAAGLLQGPEDLLRLTTADLGPADPLASTQGPPLSLYRALRGASALSLDRLLVALSVPGLDAEAARALADHFGDLERLAARDPRDLAAVPGLSPAAAAALGAYLSEARNRATLRALAAAGLGAPPP